MVSQLSCATSWIESEKTTGNTYLRAGADREMFQDRFGDLCFEVQVSRLLCGGNAQERFPSWVAKQTLIPRTR
jgi:hypothetical protein